MTTSEQGGATGTADRASGATGQPVLTHVDSRGQARMVDVSGKDITAREATAVGRVICSPTVVGLLRGEGVPKGDALAVARLAGIQAAKRTPDLVPLAHPISVHGVRVDLEVVDDGVEIACHRAHRRPHRRRDGGADLRRGGCPRPGRHGQGGGQVHRDHGCAGDRQERRTVRGLAP